MADSEQLPETKRVSKMKLKSFLNFLRVGQPASAVANIQPAEAKNGLAFGHGKKHVIDLESLNASPQLNEEQIADRIRRGHVAEMTFHSAGIQ